MEFRGLKIDLTAVAGVISAIASIVLAWKGKNKLKEREPEDDKRKDKIPP